MNLKEKIKTQLNKNKFTQRFLDYDFRTVFFTVITLITTIAYGGFYGMLGIALRSIWYGVLASYYLIIAFMRALVVFYHRQKRKRNKNLDEHKEKISRAKIYCACGIIISLLTVPLSIAIMLMIAEKATFSHEGLLIYVAALYTTIKVVLTIRHIVKARKSTDLTVRTVRSINLADTFVSVLALQTAMFHSFQPDFSTDVFNSVTGAAVCLATVIIGVFMISGSRRAITQINYEENLKKSKESEK